MSTALLHKTDNNNDLTVHSVKEKCKNKPKQSFLRAMMPGAEIKKDGNIVLNVGISREVIRFNVGGSIFETRRSTLYRIPQNPLADDQFLKKHFRKQYGDYFIDRDPDIFKK
ncbi:hypothetical protein KUTeg_010929 [Tegillarca granosa]|uniref:Potassium channel tetramerisation-type BTB domain-containing protein n=1 Tax=Tegillarca granosa TaxID=220873 RepID=A0ABQ9F2E2_TEGGR|nr:hypothetical protein KUTeg_010929 [Tegillarca granosa]